VLLLLLLLQLMYDTIKLCLNMASDAGLTTIAFPTLGCGRFHYDPCDVADCFLRAQRDAAATQLQVCLYEPGPGLVGGRPGAQQGGR